MLRSCKPLTSLHVRFRRNIILNSFLRALRTHGSSPRTLAIDYCTSRDNETDTFHQLDFGELCRICPNVYFLGLLASANELNPDTWESASEHFRFKLSSLTQMSCLRIIHIRRSRYKDDESDRSRQHIMRDLQKFCSAFFYYVVVHQACSSLKAIVIGHNVDLRDEDFELDSPYEEEVYCTQHCFVRDYETEAGETSVVAVPVHASRLRKLLLGYDLLDYDPECESLTYLPGLTHF
jgi:hypothetical protein